MFEAENGSYANSFGRAWHQPLVAPDIGPGTARHSFSCCVCQGAIRTGAEGGRFDPCLPSVPRNPVDGSVRQFDGFPATVVEILAIGVGGLGDLHHACGALGIALLALRGFHALHQLSHDEVKLGVGLGG